MHQLATACEAIAATTKKLLKTAIVADYLKSRTPDEAAVSAVFLSGRAFPAWEETTLQLGGRTLWQLLAELSGQDEGQMTASYRRHGDLGTVAAEVLTKRVARAPSPAQPTAQGLTVLEVEKAFRQIAAAHGPSAKAALARELLRSASPIEAKYIVKIMTGDLRIGLKESLVEEAIARAYAVSPKEVQRANMLLGDIGQTVRLAINGKLAEATMRLFHPLGFMLASPVDSAEEALSYFADAVIEDKYDGIRAQAHISGAEVKLFSRTRDDITESFPELPDALAGLPQDAILDGEIVAWGYEPVDRANVEPANVERANVERALLPAKAAQAAGLSIQNSKPAGRARPFSVLQQRLGRKKVSEKMLREIPVAFLIFDVLYAGGELVLDRPLKERAQILDELLAAERVQLHRSTESLRKTGQEHLPFGEEEKNAQASIIRAPVFRAASPDELEELFSAAQERGNEGLMIKDLNSPYTPGKRGKSWLKMKRELATLDVVVTAVEYGHGKRIGVLSDYTFAVWDTNSEGNTDSEGTKLGWSTSAKPIPASPTPRSSR